MTTATNMPNSNDLWTALTTGNFKEYDEKEKARKAAIRAAARKAKKAEEATAATPRPRSFPWKVVGQVLPIARVHCKTCGTTYETPCGPVLVRAEHRRSGMIWEREDWNINPSPSLPHAYRFFDKEVHHCPHCFHEFDPEGPVQLELPLTFIDPTIEELFNVNETPISE